MVAPWAARLASFSRSGTGVRPSMRVMMTVWLTVGKVYSEKVFNASTCGDNCAKWLLKIAEQEDRTVNLRHLMDFGKKPFTIKVLNTNQIVHSMEELILSAGEFV